MGGAPTRLRWHPGWLGTALTLVLLPAFTGLGVWQLRRADAAAELFAQFERQGAVEPARGLPAGDALRYARIALTGRFVPERQFLLDSMTHRGVTGYHVLAPFVPSDGGPWIIVNRGWLPGGRDRARLPDVALAEVPVTISGRLDWLPRPGIRLGGATEAEAGWPQVVLFPDMATLERRLGEPLYPLQLLLDPEAANGYLRDWGPRRAPAARHRGYAAQWFAFAALLIVLYAALGFKRRAW